MVAGWIHRRQCVDVGLTDAVVAELLGGLRDGGCVCCPFVWGHQRVRQWVSLVNGTSCTCPARVLTPVPRVCPGHGAYTCAELLRGFKAASGCTCLHNTRKTILLAAFGAGFGGALPSLEHCVQL